MEVKLDSIITETDPGGSTMVKCPCKECISFAICYNRRSIKCLDLLYYLYADDSVLLWDSNHLREVELLFKKRIDHTIGTLSTTVFKQRGLEI